MNSLQLLNVSQCALARFAAHFLDGTERSAGESISYQAMLAKAGRTAYRERCQ